MAKARHSTAVLPDRAYLVSLDLHRNLQSNATESLRELRELARTAGATVVGSTTQRRARPVSSTYIGSGKVREVAEECRRLNANTVLVDGDLTPSQQRNLEDSLGLKVIDRTALIIDIFAMGARSREGRLQVELAQMEYLLPRLAGQWNHLERLEGAIGTRGPGETQLETDRRLARRRITKITKDLKAVRKQRALYRRRRRRSGIPTVALVGYTNAGKSTLMRSLSGSEIYAGDKLFATLDPLTRRVRLTEDRTILLNDTVGFIQKLPTQLVVSFRATLEELEEASLLIHVVDISHPQASEQEEVVDATLRDLGLENRLRITALNKIDLLTNRDGRVVNNEELAHEVLAYAGQAPSNICAISAENGWGIEKLRDLVVSSLDSEKQDDIHYS